MSLAFETNSVRVYQGDVLAALALLEDESVDCAVTSPPYWGLRDYGTEGQLGLEATPEEYVAAMVAVFREVRRVLRPHGTLWLNLGDSYGTGTTAVRKQGARGIGAATQGAQDAVPRAGGMAKQMIGIPWRVAFALQADGWYLRSDIIWHKPNPMPESVTDRPTKAHEYVFLLAKSERYFYDAIGVAEPASGPTLRVPAGWDTGPGAHREKLGRYPAPAQEGTRGNGKTWAERKAAGAPDRHGLDGAAAHGDGSFATGATRNARTVWTIATQPYPEAHFATFPRELPERCIKAGTPAQVCTSCGKARERVMTIVRGERDDAGRTHSLTEQRRGKTPVPERGWESERTTLGYTDCGHDAYAPGVVLDPFAGSGTTLEVATALGRRSIGIELNPEYVRLIERRCGQLALELA